MFWNAKINRFASSKNVISESPGTVCAAFYVSFKCFSELPVLFISAIIGKILSID
jgi:hypothetical protein